MKKYDSQKVDTKADQRALGFKNVGVSSNGRWIRIEFVQQDQKTEFPVQIAADLLDKLLPVLLSMAGEAERRRTGKNAKRVFRIREGAVSKTSTNDVVFEFTDPTGLSFAFELDRDGAALVLSSLSKVLQLADSQTGKADPPRQH